MRSFAVVSALAAVATAQLSSMVVSSRTSLGNVVPSATQSVSGPISTDRACAQIASAISRTRSQNVILEASIAYACLKSVPISQEDAAFTVNSIKQMTEFQSTLAYLKDPPQGWPNEAVDIIGGLDAISSKVTSGGYTNEYDFEAEIADLFARSHDGHLGFNGMAYSGTFYWRRSSSIALVSASRDGSGLPRIWALGDFNKTGGSFEPSPITQIDGKDVLQFLGEEANRTSYHDPDARYNALFFLQPAESYGQFTSPRFYPGDTTRVTFENGTTNEYRNAAIVLDPASWQGVSSPQSFYQTFISPSTSSRKVKKRDPNALPRNLENPRDLEFYGSTVIQHGSVPVFYPRPVVAHTAPNTPLAGYFINTAVGQIGVLVVQTFNTPDAATSVEFQSVVQRYIAQAKSRGVTKHIIDVRTNGGGKVILGYDLYKQFFPSQVPQTQSRYRGHPASELFGSRISSIIRPTSANLDLYSSPFSNDAYLNKDLQAFPDWKAMYPPDRFHNDNFTTLLKYNLSDPLTTSDPRLGTGITVTGYGNRADYTQDPFRAEDIIILSDGICASTCSIFTELMSQQSGVKTLTIGGRPQPGPMQHTGGTKGTLVLPAEYLQSLSAYAISTYASTRAEAQSWLAFVPNPFAIAYSDASINFQDNIRVGLESGGVPSQFLNDSSSCRVWYEPEMYLNVTRVWDKVARTAFGNNGALDEAACVAGSVASRDMQTGQGAGNPGVGDASEQGGKKKGAGSAVRPSLMGVVAVASFVVFALGGGGMGVVG